MAVPSPGAGGRWDAERLSAEVDAHPLHGSIGWLPTPDVTLEIGSHARQIHARLVVWRQKYFWRDVGRVAAQ